MKGRIIPLVIATLFSCLSFAQKKSSDFKNTWSNPIKYKAAVFLVGAKKIDNGYLIFDKEAIRGPGGFKYFIEIFDEDMKFVKQIDISKSVDEKIYKIVDVLTYGDNFLLITSRAYKREQREEIYIQTIDVQDDDVTVGKRRKLHEEPYYVGKKKSNYLLSISPNEKRLLIQAFTPGTRKHESSLSLILLDSQLDIMWTALDIVFKDDTKTENTYYNILNIIVNDEGDVYLNGRPYESKRKGLGSILSLDNFSYVGDKFNCEIFKIEDGEFTGQKITLKDERLGTMKIVFGKDNKLHCLGYYFDKEKHKYIEGMVSYVIDSELSSILNEQFVAFDDKLETAGLKGRDLKKIQRKLDKGKPTDQIKSLYIEDFIRKDDGSIQIIGEKQYTDVVTTTSASGSTSTKTYYVYDLILLSTVNASGEVLSTKILRKHESFSRVTPKHNLFFSVNGKFFRIDGKYRFQLLNPDSDKRKKDFLYIAQSFDDKDNQNEEVLYNFGKIRKPSANLGEQGKVLSNNDVIVLVKEGRDEYKYLRIRPVR